MSEFKISYRKPHGHKKFPEKTTVRPRIDARAKKLLFETCIAALCMFSVMGNIFSYTYIEKMQHQHDAQILQYDSLLSAKLLSDQELIRIRSQLHKSSAEEKLVRALPANASASSEEHSLTDR